MQEIWDASLNPWIGKILWRRKWLPTPVFLPGESHDRGPWRATVHGVTKSQTQLKWQHPHTDKQPVTIKSRYYFYYWLYICVCVYVCACVYIIYVCVCLCCSVAKSCPTLQLHGLQHVRPPCPYLLEFVQVHVHWIGDVQPSHPLSPSSPLAFDLSQHQNLFQWVCFSHQVVKVLELQLQHQSFQWVFRVDFC